MTTHLQFNNVKKIRGNFTLNVPTIAVQQGEILGVIGNNGAGKSTMIQMVLGLLHSTEGSIDYYHDGEQYQEVGGWKQYAGFVYDDLSIYDEVKMTKLSALLKGVYSNWDSDYFMELLRTYEVDPHKKVKEFSRGMKMKAGIAAALAHRPKFLLLDEPTAGLDTKSRKQMIRLLKEANDQGTTVVFSSHILSDMEELATSVWLMDKGEVLIHGEVEDLKNQYQKDSEGRIYPAKEGEGNKVTLEDLHDYYLGGEEE